MNEKKDKNRKKITKREKNNDGKLNDKNNDKEI